jgi:hypothetical protein
MYAQSDTLLINLKNGNVEKIAISDLESIQFAPFTGVENSQEQSKGLQVKGNYPNPFTDQTNIKFEINKPGTVVIMIYNNSGNRVQQLKCENCQPGKNSLLWNCMDNNNERVPSGTYYYEVYFENEVLSKKMIIIK